MSSTLLSDAVTLRVKITKEMPDCSNPGYRTFTIHHRVAIFHGPTTFPFDSSWSGR